MKVKKMLHLILLNVLVIVRRNFEINIHQLTLVEKRNPNRKVKIFSLKGHLFRHNLSPFNIGKGFSLNQLFIKLFGFHFLSL